MIVVDLGCHDHPDHPGSSQDSIGALIERFHPATLYGFDPAATPRDAQRNGSRVVVNPNAAWIRAGLIGYQPAGLGSRTLAGDGLQVACFPFSVWLRDLAATHPDDEIVVKLDVEGAEYALLERLIRDKHDQLVTLLLVEWHDWPYDAQQREAAIRGRLHCPLEEWA